MQVVSAKHGCHKLVCLLLTVVSGSKRPAQLALAVAKPVTFGDGCPHSRGDDQDTFGGVLVDWCCADKEDQDHVQRQACNQATEQTATQGESKARLVRVSSEARQQSRSTHAAWPLCHKSPIGTTPCGDTRTHAPMQACYSGALAAGDADASAQQSREQQAGLMRMQLAWKPSPLRAGL